MADVPILILTHPDDRIAVRVYSALRDHLGAESIKIASDEELACARRWDHHLASSGNRTVVELSDGTVLDSDGIGVVLNRLRSVEHRHFQTLSPTDRQYAAMETHALWLSWLFSLPCPVINPATPRGLCSSVRGDAEWLYLAGTIGLPTRGWQLSTNARRFAHAGYAPHQVSAAPSWHTRGDEGNPPTLAGKTPALFLEQVQDEAWAVVVGSQVVGPLAGPWDSELLELSMLSECPLLEVAFGRVRNGAWTLPQDWRLCGVSGYVQAESDEVIAAMCHLLLMHAANKGESRGQP